MFSFTLPPYLLLLLSCLCLTGASPTQQPFRLLTDQHHHEDGGTVTLAGWHDPRIGGGRLLDYTTKKRGEPLNVIVSGTSDPFILTDEGFIAYVQSIGYARECMGLHMGHIHLANLGDGDGRKPEGLLFRQHYQMPRWGTCWESFAGGHHFRAWRQNGTDANSGAWFLGASKEEDSRRGHTIVANGYNLGRDWLVEQALAGSEFWIPKPEETDQPETAGWPWPGTGGERIEWRAEVEWQAGLLEPGSEGVNHNIPQDGLVAVLTVFRVQSD
ncbi:hypothetical protein FB45DRAFT_896068 [Roridomyces roridus]|uniref:Uncharacterized protein n=1 Tax=Roridomyces roridus TaxID=1738132 RepID=A0AAD7FY26_9AGAR|nr:hypothetical protein FB45DRAFT_896068 [Roridomyces roridus]